MSAPSEGAGPTPCTECESIIGPYHSRMDTSCLPYRKLVISILDRIDRKENTLEGKVFVEKDFYVEPPKLPDTATEAEIKKAWANWITANARERAKHKRRWTRAQKPGDLPDFNKANTMVKIQGVWKQRQGMVGLVGDVGLRTLETVLTELAKQDKYYQARGKRAERNGNKHRNGRRNKKEIKRQLVLNKKAQQGE